MTSSFVGDNDDASNTNDDNNTDTVYNSDDDDDDNGDDDNDHSNMYIHNASARIGVNRSLFSNSLSSVDI